MVIAVTIPTAVGQLILAVNMVPYLIPNNKI